MTTEPTRDHLYVNEIFGPTIQGEGPAVGQPATFLRLAGCNLACSWCDTKYTWDWKQYDKAAESHRTHVVDVDDQLEQHRPPGRRPLLVVTGGEPMLQQSALATWYTVGGHHWRVEVETAGTIVPDHRWGSAVHRFVVSPKLQHSGNPIEKRYRPAALRALSDSGKAVWKFVASKVGDLVEIDAILDELELVGQVYVMPLGTTVDDLNRRTAELADAVIGRGWFLTPRLHIATWGNKRGV